MNRKRMLESGTSRTLLCVSAALTSSAAVAAEDPAASFNDQIVVTATKKAVGENLQDIPAAITAFDQEMIETRKLRDLQGLTYAVPGVSLDAVGTFRGTANFAIRGLGINSSIASVDPAVGTFVDGVYMGINAGVVLDLFDVQRVEILRGPQGTLYGRNTTGGAVLIETGDPTAEWRFEGAASLEGLLDGGRGGPSRTVHAVVSGPVGRDVAFKIGAYYNNDSGYFRNQFNGSNLGAAETLILRSGLSLERGRLRLLAKGDYLKSDGDGAVGQNHGHFSRDSFDVSLDNEGGINIRSWFGVFRADYEVESGAITNIAGYRSFSQFTNNDIDSTPRFLFHSQTALRQEQISDELRYAGRFGALDLTFGAYLFHQEIAYQEDRVFPAGAPQLGGGRQSHDTYALFGQGEYELSSGMSFIAGLRWNREDKSGAITYVRSRPECSVLEKTCPTSGKNAFLPAEPNGFGEKRSWSNVAPRLGIEYQPQQSSLFYGTWTRGYRSGGFNVRVTQPLSFEALAAANGTYAYGEERVDTYELGSKLTAMGRRATLNLAAYRTDVRDLQREVNVASPTSGLAQSIFNTADARIWGGEAEARLVLNSTVLSANAGYIHARYRDVRYDISGDGAVGPADAQLKLPRVPEWTFGGEVLHSVPFNGSSSFTFRTAYQRREAYAWTDSNFGWVGASDNLDADVTLNLLNEKIRLSIYGRNLLDEVQFGGDTQLGFAGGPLSDGNSRPFDPRPAAGTFSPLSKGRLLGVDLRFSY